MNCWTGRVVDEVFPGPFRQVRCLSLLFRSSALDTKNVQNMIFSLCFGFFPFNLNLFLVDFERNYCC